MRLIAVAWLILTLLPISVAVAAKSEGWWRSTPSELAPKPSRAKRSVPQKTVLVASLESFNQLNRTSDNLLDLESAETRLRRRVILEGGYRTKRQPKEIEFSVKK